LQKAVAETQGRFENCYFMFSCRKDQVSFQDPNHLSDFTEAFANAVREYAGSSIRYADIAASIADTFTTSVEQTPLFISQSSLTEVFCDVTSSMLAIVDAALAKASEGIVATEMAGAIVPTLAELVMKHATQYCDQEEAMKAVAIIPQTANDHSFGNDLNALFRVFIQIHPELEMIILRRSNMEEKNTLRRNMCQRHQTTLMNLILKSTVSGQAMNTGP
jgi:hypothetical protein